MSYLRFAASFALVALGASCQSMSEGVFSLEGRAIVLDDTEADEDFGGVGEDEVDVSGYGVAGAFSTPVVDLLAAIEVREFEDEDTPELALGVRRRFLEIGPFHPFVEGNLRYGDGLDNGVDEESYTGWNAGVGALFDLGDRFFLSARLMYELTPIDTPTGDVDVDGLVGTLGFGIKFL